MTSGNNLRILTENLFINKTIAFFVYSDYSLAMKLLVMLPHGNTAAFLEQQRASLAEKTSCKIFSFSPLYFPLAILPEKDYTAFEAKSVLTGARDAITSSTKKEICTLEKLHASSFGSITAFFCTGSFSFLEDILSFCEKNGFEPLTERAPGFCVGFLCDTKDNRPVHEFDTEFEPHRMTVFRLGLMDFTPDAPFLQENGKSGICGSAENAEPLSFRWKLISSVWKAKPKEA